MFADWKGGKLGALLQYYIIAVSAIFALMLAADTIKLKGGNRKSKTVQSQGRYLPRVLVIVPCRGKDRGLVANLKSIKMQEYPDFRAIAVVDDRDDPAVEAIEKAKMRHIISNVQCSRCSGKVRAIASAIKMNPGYDVYVVADSDIRVGRRWLSELVMPLADRSVGVSTMFPRFVPEGGIVSLIKFAWGFVGEGLMESDATRFVWGGSMAFRRSLVAGDKRMRFFLESEFSVSDDITIMKMAKKDQLGIWYVGRHHPEVRSVDNFPEFVEWSNRQAALSVLGQRRNLYVGLVYYSSESLLVVTGIALSLYNPLYLVLLLHAAITAYRTKRRMGGDATASAIIASALMPFLYVYNLSCAAFMRRITWRGRMYSLRQNSS